MARTKAFLGSFGATLVASLSMPVLQAQSPVPWASPSMPTYAVSVPSTAPTAGCCPNPTATGCRVGADANKPTYRWNGTDYVSWPVFDTVVGDPRYFRGSITSPASGPSPLPDKTQPANVYYVYDSIETRKKAAANIELARATQPNQELPWNQVFGNYMDRYKEELPTRFPSPGNCQDGNDEMDALDKSIATLEKQITKVKSALAGMNLDPDPQPSQIIPYPDADQGFIAARFLRDASGKRIDAKNESQAIRIWLAETFERMVRIFIAGSKQLEIDFPPPAPAPGVSPVVHQGVHIYGLYQGFLPDLLNTTKTKVLYFGQTPAWSLCAPEQQTGSGPTQGTANFMNKTMGWFKGKDGNPVDETIRTVPGGIEVVNHHCKGIQTDENYSGAPTVRGTEVDLMMQLMAGIKKNILEKGRVRKTASYGVIDSCAETEAKILAFRKKIKEGLDDLKARQPKGSKAIECGDELDAEDPELKYIASLTSLTPKKGLKGPQHQACVLASMQTEIEMKMMAQYTYCTWQTVALKIRERMTRAAGNTAWNVPQKPKQAPNEESLAWLGLSLSGFGAFAKKRGRRREKRAAAAGVFVAVSLIASSCKVDDVPNLTCSGYKAEDVKTWDELLEEGNANEQVKEPVLKSPFAVMNRRSELAGTCIEACKPMIDATQNYNIEMQNAQTQMQTIGTQYGSSLTDVLNSQMQRNEDLRSKTGLAYTEALYRCQTEQTFTGKKGRSSRADRRAKDENVKIAQSSCECNAPEDSLGVPGQIMDDTNPEIQMTFLKGDSEAMKHKDMTAIANRAGPPDRVKHGLIFPDESGGEFSGMAERAITEFNGLRNGGASVGSTRLVPMQWVDVDPLAYQDPNALNDMAMDMEGSVGFMDPVMGAPSPMNEAQLWNAANGTPDPSQDHDRADETRLASVVSGGNYKSVSAATSSSSSGSGRSSGSFGQSGGPQVGQGQTFEALNFPGSESGSDTDASGTTGSKGKGASGVDRAIASVHGKGGHPGQAQDANGKAIDYFQLIDRRESLFKRASMRYGETNRSWIREDILKKPVPGK
ncbi:MAG: hypothetical protein JNL01_00625 [Bdellovibrionales bacterium]|nr:hypothetical protein [Bdellovibrionales bacterium]